MRRARRLGPLLQGITLLSFFLPACALQSSMVDIEDSSTRLRKHQIQLQRRIERLERNLNSPSQIVKNQQSLSAELIAQLGVIESDVRQFSGQVTESEHKMSQLENRVDAESFRTKDLMNRLEALETRIAALESGGADKKRKPDGLRGRSKKKRSFLRRGMPLILPTMIT